MATITEECRNGCVDRSVTNRSTGRKATEEDGRQQHQRTRTFQGSAVFPRSSSWFRSTHSCRRMKLYGRFVHLDVTSILKPIVELPELAARARCREACAGLRAPAAAAASSRQGRLPSICVVVVGGALPTFEQLGVIERAHASWPAYSSHGCISARARATMSDSTSPWGWTVADHGPDRPAHASDGLDLLWPSPHHRTAHPHDVNEGARRSLYADRAQDARKNQAHTR